MWSGPRNISTAMMRSWENRADTQVVDEPFYAFYLSHYDTDHPMTPEVLASQPTSWEEVVEQLILCPMVEPVYYQKHMTHHMLPGMDLSWTQQLQHCFLIRDPELVVNSYAQKRETVTSEDIGITRQYELYEEISAITGQKIPIVVGADVLKNPRDMLSTLCECLDVPFSQSMLSWPPGRRESDGVWAPHWYEAVEASTGFAPYKTAQLQLTAKQQAVADANQAPYQALFEKRLIV